MSLLGGFKKLLGDAGNAVSQAVMPQQIRDAATKASTSSYLVAARTHNRLLGAVLLGLQMVGCHTLSSRCNILAMTASHYRTKTM